MTAQSIVDRPGTMAEAAATIRAHAQAGRVMRPRGGGTKLGWCPASEQPVTDLDMRGLNQIIEHNAGDFTAILEAGVTLKDAQLAFAGAGQMLALDPPLGADESATIGGIMASNDSGPLRHRYGSMRDLVIGITVVLSDGTIAKSGGRVIKNVAGYDLARLFTGSMGTLGMIARVAVRLHPLPQATATVLGQSDDPDRMAAAVLAIARAPVEADCFDVLWAGGHGTLLLRFAGRAADQRARAAVHRMVGLEAVETVSDDTQLWAQQRARQRSAEGLVIKVSARTTDLATVLRTARARGTIVARAGLGLFWVSMPGDFNVAALRQALAPRACTVLDGADRVPDPWPVLEPRTRVLMQRVKDRFDPDRVFRPGVIAGGM